MKRILLSRWLFPFLMVVPVCCIAQTDINDTTTVRIGYVKGVMSTMAGAIDQVTEERMNKALLLLTKKRQDCFFS